MNLLAVEISDQKTAESWAPWVKVGDTVYYCVMCEDKEVPKQAGFSFHGKKVNNVWTGKKLWWTNDIQKASQLSEFAIEKNLKEKLSGIKIHKEKSLEASSLVGTDADLPHPEGLDYFPFQKAGIQYINSRKNTLLGDDMGLGKTIQAIGYCNVNKSIRTVLVICPATLKLNWQREARTWLVDKRKVAIADNGIVPMPEHGYEFIITNYEMVSKINKQLSSIEWDLMVIDEAHYIKNQKTERYLSIAGGKIEKERKTKDKYGNTVAKTDEFGNKIVVKKEWSPIRAKHVIAATGTPICNRPKELWALLMLLDKDNWKDKWFYFKKRYCDCTSKERMNELQIKLRETIMVRRLKSEVLKELPPKIRQVIELEYNEDDMQVRAALEHERQYENLHSEGMETAAVLVELAKAEESEEAYKQAIERLKDQNSWRFEEMAKVRYETAVAKIPYAIEFLEEQLESVDKIIVFAHHHEVIEAVAKKWPLESVSIYGEVSTDKRQAAVDRFQNDPNCKIAIVSIKAGGVGITLTAASYEYFLELDWTPGNLSQAEDRAHRIGQTDTVNVFHLVLRDSIDVRMAKKIIEKQRIIEAALDKIDDIEPVIETKQEASTKHVTRKQLEKDAVEIKRELVPYIQDALRMMVSMDGDYARSENMIGFNKIDSQIGHSLAEFDRLSPKQAALGKRLLKKYHRQIPAYLYNKIFEIEEEW